LAARRPGRFCETGLNENDCLRERPSEIVVHVGREAQRFAGMLPVDPTCLKCREGADLLREKATSPQARLARAGLHYARKSYARPPNDEFRSPIGAR
jgi:hypothetical protein